MRFRSSTAQKKNGGETQHSMFASKALDERTVVVKVATEEKWCEQEWESLTRKPGKAARKWGYRVLDIARTWLIFSLATRCRIVGGKPLAFDI